ncbi:MAG TPA: DUF719 domain-containing protein [Sedimentisphaerales bacterium]|nr:DUF719 domain-containing protein [Sedimentisphaerales bacterium]
MKSPITKLAAAAVVVVAVLIGINQLGGSATSVVWGEVVRNIEASPGFIYRMKQTHNQQETGTIELNMMAYGSAQYGFRLDGYNDEEVTIQTYATLSDGAMTSVDHPNRTYYRTALADDALAEIENMEPKETVREYLSAEYTKLGRRTIEGVEAEGIEIDRDPSEAKANFQVDSCVIQLWVAVDTGLPILVEVDTVGKNGTLEIHTVQDNFQWNVELDASEFEPNIPEDYTQMDVEIDADGKVSYKTTVKYDSQEVAGARIHKWRFMEKHPKGHYILESEDGQTRATIPESWADSPEHAVRVMEELDLLKQQGNRKLVRVSETEVNGQLDSRYLLYEYALSDGQVIEDGDFDPALTNTRTLVGERQEELSQLLRERRRQEEKGQELVTTEERQVYGRVFAFKKRRFALSDGTEVIHSIGRLKDD